MGGGEGSQSTKHGGAWDKWHVWQTYQYNFYQRIYKLKWSACNGKWKGILTNSEREYKNSIKTSYENLKQNVRDKRSSVPGGISAELIKNGGPSNMPY